MGSGRISRLRAVKADTSLGRLTGEEGREGDGVLNLFAREEFRRREVETPEQRGQGKGEVILSIAAGKC